ncbi:MULTISPECIES: hypothetical protein [Cryobacterium]|uniref:hypothetical protein n=1 Tax=Cryobacterium TaxID=69578 RepID=UPI00106B6462|nr:MULTISPECIES: hypothetical protein [Cryobacterium]TFD49545.1 hypothetical protein E3T33_00065 [Cryobacterium sp. TMT1-2-1]TFD90225.1 hypothetical protein E3T56_01520 [Cryobacterium psychrotolerans]
MPGTTGQLDRTALNARIDDGAAEAGRDPRSIRRLLNVGGAFTPSAEGLLRGPPGRWAEDLASMTLEHGMSEYILATDDAATIQRFAAEVAPRGQSTAPSVAESTESTRCIGDTRQIRRFWAQPTAPSREPRMPGRAPRPRSG